MSKTTLFTTLIVASFFANSLFALELVMVEQKGCSYCEKWDKEVAPEYGLTELGRAAPLRRVDIHDMDDESFKLDSKVVFTPTFIFVENDVEVKRLEGYYSEDFFWGISEEFLAHYSENEPTQK